MHRPGHCETTKRSPRNAARCARLLSFGQSSTRLANGRSCACERRAESSMGAQTKGLVCDVTNLQQGFAMVMCRIGRVGG